MPATSARFRVRAAGHVFLLACVLLLAWAAAEARAAAVPAQFYGVNSGSTLFEDAEARPAALQAMRAGGLTFVRVDASWGAIEPTPPTGGVHSYAWARYDLFVADLARSGLRWYPMLGYSSPWASSAARDPFAPPASDADFAAFATAVAQRYGPGGNFWAEHPELPKLPTAVYEIWNEPSNDMFWHGAEATPARYMSLYLAARAAIKSVDPRARVATAGLLDSGVIDGDAYLRAMLDAAPAALNQIDAVGWHPYAGDLSQILASIKRARTTLDRHGLGTVPIEISEVGWHTGFTPAQRSAWLGGLARMLPCTGMRVTRLSPYVWAGDPVWQITNPDGSLGQFAGAYFAGIRSASLPRRAMTRRSKAETAPRRRKVEALARRCAERRRLARAVQDGRRSRLQRAQGGRRRDVRGIAARRGCDGCAALPPSRSAWRQTSPCGCASPVARSR